MLHLGPIWYHSEPSDVSYSKNLPRPISWFGLFLQQNDSNIVSPIRLKKGIKICLFYDFQANYLVGRKKWLISIWTQKK